MRDPFQPQHVLPHLLLTVLAFAFAATDWSARSRPRGATTLDWQPAKVRGWSASELWVRANRSSRQRMLAFNSRRQAYLAMLESQDAVMDPFELATVEFEPSQTPLPRDLTDPEPSLPKLEGFVPARSVAMSSQEPRPTVVDPRRATQEIALLPPQTAVALPEFGNASLHSQPAAANAAALHKPAEGEGTEQPSIAHLSADAPDFLCEDETQQENSANTLGSSPTATPEAGGWIPYCESLFKYLDELSLECDSSVWALRAQAALSELASGKPGVRRREELLENLRLLAGMADSLAGRITDRQTRSTLSRAQQALLRRIHVWEAVNALASTPPATLASARANARALTLAAQEADAFLGSSDEGERWRAYLMLENLADSSRGCDSQFVSRVLSRWDAPQLSLAQRNFLTSPKLAALEKALVLQLDAIALRENLLQKLESFEETHSSSDSRMVSVILRRALVHAQGNKEAHKELHDHIEKHYRNANLRIAVSEDMLNRILPDDGPVEGFVKDTVVGVPVRGRSTTYSQLEIDLHPSNQSIAATFLVHGLVHSRTTSSSGPAHLASRTRSKFDGQKQLWLAADGIRASPASADATASSDLVRLSTDFDRVPLVGAFVRTIARSQHEELKPQVRKETASKIEKRAEAEFDARVNEQLSAAEHRFKEKVIERLQLLALRLDSLQMESTDDRAIVRLRLAGDDQLAANTPRPQALADSLASLQVHESAINNFLDRLDLAGREFSLQELIAHLSQKLSAPLAMNRERELPDDLYIYFASEDPIRIRFEKGGLYICLRLDGLARGDQEYGNVDVEVSYYVDFQGPVPALVRGESVALSGRPLGFRERMALQGVFAKVFPKDKRLPLAVGALSNDPRFAGLALSQIVMQDGWLGVSLADLRESVAKKDTALPAGVRTALPTSGMAAW